MNTTQAVVRHELKYYINQNDYLILKSILDKTLSKDLYQGNTGGYFIRSVYFDDFHDSAMEEKLSGVQNRSKYRLRIYDLKQDWAKLERKSKFDNYINKVSVHIDRNAVSDALKGNFSFLQNIEGEHASQLLFDLSKKHVKPVLLVDYVRDAYTLPFNNVRVTFDKQLRVNTSHFSIFDDTVDTMPMQKSDVVILEIKYNNFLPRWISHLLQGRSSTRSAISKYAQGRLGYQNSYFT